MARALRRLAMGACFAIAAAGCQGFASATPSPAIATPLVVPSGTPATSGAVASEPVMTEGPSAQPPSAGPFALTSSVFAPGGSIPRQYTCDGQDTSPPLEWSGAPDGIMTLALVVTDPDANDFVHWVVFNVEAGNSGGFPTGFSSSPDGPPQGRNSFGKVGYGDRKSTRLNSN